MKTQRGNGVSGAGVVVKVRADATGGNRDALRHDHLTFHAALQADDGAASGSRRSESERSGDRAARHEPWNC